MADSVRLPLYVYVDVDDTFVRSFSSKRISMPNVLRHVRALAADGAILYCWSSGGAEYVRQSAEEFGIAELFVDFLPKPNVLIDDQRIEDWRYLTQAHPGSCESECRASYERAIGRGHHDNSDGE